MMEENTSDLVAKIVPMAASWIKLRHEYFSENGQLLPDSQVDVLRPYFDENVLRAVRIAFVDSVDNPPFYQELRDWGLEPPDFTLQRAMTFDSSVIMKHEIRNELDILFHELIHVLQYRELGVDEFMRRYVVGYFQNGQIYQLIPLEADAYWFQDEFKDGRLPTRRVLREVRRRLAGWMG